MRSLEILHLFNSKYIYKSYTKLDWLLWNQWLCRHFIVYRLFTDEYGDLFCATHDLDMYKVEFRVFKLLEVQSHFAKNQSHPPLPNYNIHWTVSFVLQRFFFFEFVEWVYMKVKRLVMNIVWMLLKVFSIRSYYDCVLFYT